MNRFAVAVSLMALCATTVQAEEVKAVDFTAPGGVKCRLTAEGASMWRVRTARADGTFAEVGAVQALSRWMGETMRTAPRPLREAASADGARTFAAPDGSQAVLAADGSSLAFLSATGRKVVEVTRLVPGAEGSLLAGRLLQKEAVYGLGERLDRLNKRGTRVAVLTRDGYNDSSASYVAIPLFSTTRGGGVFVNAYECMTADLGATSPDEWRMEIAKDSIDAYVIATDLMRDVPPRYMALAGCPSVPDDWQFGPVACRYAPDYAAFEGPTSRVVHKYLTLGQGLKNVVDKYREMGSLPTAVIAEGRSCEIFGSTPEAQAKNRAEFMKGTDYLAKDGIRYMIYMAMGSAVLRSAPGFKPEYEVHVAVTDAAGNVKVKRTNRIPFVTFTSNNPDVRKGHKGSLYLDITDPEAWQWYLDQVWQPLLDCGVRGAKIDFCEEMPDDGALYGDVRFRYQWKHPEVFEGAAVHHAYPSFFIAKLCRDLTARLKARGQGSFMALARGGGIGVHRAPFLWAGDQKRAFEKLDDQLLAMLNSGVSGIPFMTYDMAGYHYTSPVQTPVAVRNRKTGAYDLTRTEPGQDEEVVYRRYSGDLPFDAEQRLFLRGLEFTTYSPCIQTHGYVRHPYEFDAATRACYVSYAARHRALSGEIAAASLKATRTGIPMVRPLVWDYQDDANTWDIEDEYIFCDRYLVAPVLKDVTSREVYLPEGTWRELATGTVRKAPASGLRVTLSVPVDAIPVFVRDEEGSTAVGGTPYCLSASFISPQDWAGKGNVAVFERRFSNSKDVRRATWAVTAQGVFEAYVNGRRVGDDFLKPGVTECGKCRHVYSYDVTGMLTRRAGEANVLSATVSPGWWCDQMMRPPDKTPNWQRGNKREWQLGKEIAFRGELHVEFGDGSKETFGTDENWLAAYTGPVVSAGIYEGEVYDARRVVSGLKSARRNTEFSGELRPAAAKIALRDDLVLKPREMYVTCGAEGATDAAFGRAKVVRRHVDGDAVRLGPGEMLVVDFAQNCSAVPSFELTGEAGTELEIRASEMLNESNGEKSRGNDGPAGTPYLASLRSAYAGIRYTLKDGAQSYRPRFTYFGYRYLGVTATKPVTFRRWRSTPVSSVTKAMETGRIVTGNGRVNRLIENIRWGLLSNYLSSPTDCPQRDERMGWTADTQVFMNSAAYLADTKEFLRKYLADLRDAQRASGCYMCFVPNVRHTFPPWASAGWTDAGVIMPYRLWKWYGDRSFVDDAWDSMARYMDFLEGNEEPYRINHGDWLAFEHHLKAKGDAMDPRQVKALNAYFRVWMAMLMREMASATGRADAARHYADEEAKLRRAFAATYMGADGTIKDEYKGQCNDLYMLKLGLCGNAAAEEKTKRDLIDNIRAHGDRLQTGFLGTAILMPVLTFKAGAPELAYSLLLQDKFPSWLYSVDQGATTVWERWNGYTKEKGFGPVGMNSFNHYAYGCVMEWLFAAAAGIRQEEGAVGWSRFMLAPIPDRRLGSVDAEYRSPAGLIRSAWRYEGEKWIWEFSVPTGAAAVVLPPGAASPQTYAAGSYKIER